MMMNTSVLMMGAVGSAPARWVPDSERAR